jgi:chlorite dismutase
MAVVIRPHATQTVVFDSSEYSALMSLLSEMRSEEVVRKIARENNMGLGANQVEAIAGLWKSLAFNEVDAK